MRKFVRTIVAVGIVTQFVGPLNSFGVSPFALETQTVQAQSATPQEHAQYVVDGLAEIYPDDRLPTYVLTPDMPEYVTAATTNRSDQENFNIFYYAEDEPIKINDPAVNELTPIASLSKTSYASEEEAAGAVDQILDLQGEEVDLGYGHTGFMQGAAGSTYLNWQEGNWSLLVQASNMAGEDPIPLAEEVVDYLEEVYLPAPTDVGQITLRVSGDGNYDDNTVVWHEGAVVYEVKHADPMHAVIMAGSISEPTEQ